MPEEAPLLALEAAEAFLLTLPRLPRVLRSRVGAQLGITVDADAADVGGPDRPHREEAVLPSARVNHAFVEMEKTWTKNQSNIVQILAGFSRAPKITLTCNLTDDRGTDAKQLSMEVAPSFNRPIHGRVEAVVVARSEVDHGVVQPIALSTRGKLRRRV